VSAPATNEISDWLDSLGMSEYAERFAENKIDVSVLRHLTDQDLKDIGVPLGHRRRMLAAISELVGTDKAVTRTIAVVEPKAQDTAERRQVTVLFSDLVGSTALAGRMDPEDLREIISAYQKCVAEAVRRFGGFVAKYMGDGVLVYFGYPQAHEDDAERAVRAGLELIAAVSALKAASPLQTRVGIATGLVVVGDLVGSGDAQERGIVGETPNLAARLQGIAEPDTVAIAESTRKLLGGLFDLQDLGTSEVKGIAEPVRAYAALRLSSVESRFKALRTATTPLVGRDEEIELLMRRWAQAKAGDGCVVLISGEPGIGKSRIAEAVQERLGAEPHTRLRFFCSPYHEDSALYPAVAQLERAAGFRREDTPEQRLAKLEAVLVQATNDLSEVAPLIADLLSIPTGERYPALGLTPQKRKEKTLQALAAQAEGLAVQQPVLMIFEDVHWSDPTTRELLDLLIERVPALRLLVVITFRPEFSPPWVGRPQVTLLTLNRLPTRQRIEMISRMIGGKALPREIADQIVERTDGVPLFIEELTKAVIESGVVADAGDGYTTMGAVPSLVIPTSLHASLLARLDRLAPTREVAQIGAALGRQFSHELISAVTTMPQERLTDALEQLTSAELVFRRGTPPDAEYTFKHALVRDAAYETLLRSNRQQLHARIAAVFESKFPETAAATPEVLAQHYTAAGVAERAIRYWLKAGEAALQRSNLAEATNNLKKGLELIPNIADEKVCAQLELNLQVTLAATLSGSKGFAMPEVEQAYVRARTLCDQIGGAPELLPVLYGLFVFHWVRGHLETARGNAEEMLRIAEEADDASLLLIAHYSLGGVLWHIGENRTALDHLLQAHAQYDEKVHASLASAYGQDFGVWTLSYLEHAHLVLGYPDKGSRAIHEALALAHRLNHPLSLCNALMFNAMSSGHRHEGALASKFSEEARNLATKHGFPQYVAITTGGRQGIVARREIGMNVGLPLALTSIAEGLLAGGQARAALDCTDEALSWIKENGERAHECYVHCCRGDIFRVLSEPDRARDEYETAISVARQQEAKFWELRASVHLARLWRDQGKRTEARDLLAPVYGWFTEGLDTPVLQDAKKLLDQLGGGQPVLAGPG
jgi:class 3 adenylate cyclase/tetratricopeptide (TPR) repeat protein